MKVYGVQIDVAQGYGTSDEFVETAVRMHSRIVLCDTNLFYASKLVKPRYRYKAQEGLIGVGLEVCVGRSRMNAERVVCIAKDKKGWSHLARFTSAPTENTRAIRLVSDKEFLSCLGGLAVITPGGRNDLTDQVLERGGEVYKFADLPFAEKRLQEIAFPVISYESLKNYKGAQIYSKEDIEALRRELHVIAEMGASRYLLDIAEICSHARSCGITLGPGRGSAVGSLVVYTLGITSNDPREYHLSLDRFF